MGRESGEMMIELDVRDHKESGTESRRLYWRRGPCLRTTLAVVAGLLLYCWFTGNYEPCIPPPLPVPNPNALDAYLQVGRSLQQTGALAPAYPGGFFRAPSLPGEIAVASRCAPLLTKVRSALSMPCAMPAQRGPHQDYQYLTEIRPIDYLLAADADVRYSKGDYAGEAQTGLDLIALGMQIERGGNAVHEYVSERLQRRGHRYIASALDHLTASQCDRVAGRLRRLVNSRTPASEIVREQKYSTLSEMVHYDGSESSSDMHVSLPHISLPSGIENSIARGRWRVYRNRAIRQVEADFDSMASQSERPPYLRNPPPVPTVPGASVVALYSYTVTKYDISATRSRLLLCALSIRSYLLRRQHLPEQLPELGLDAADTTDPFNGKPFVYRRQNGDFLLYSVGPDGRDNHGIPGSASLREDGALSSDLGIAEFWPADARIYNPYYRRVPHMLPPRMAPGAMPLLP